MKDSQVNLTELHREINLRFQLDDLYDLCQILIVNFEDFAGSGKSAKTREIIAYLARQDRLDDLISACNQLQPDNDWDKWQNKMKSGASNTAERLEDLPYPERNQEVRIESHSINSYFKFDYNYLQLREFIRESFTLDELLKFMNDSESFKEFGFNLPVNASHNSIIRDLLGFAQRRGMEALLFEQLNNAKPTLYEKHTPFIESGQLNINVKFVIKGDATHLKDLFEDPPGEEFEQKIYQAAKQAFFEEI